MIAQAHTYIRVVAEKTNLIFRLPVEMKAAWEAATGARKISQQEAGEALVAWFVGLDDVAQAMVLGQIPASADLLKLALDRAASSGVVGKIDRSDKRILRAPRAARKIAKGEQR